MNSYATPPSCQDNALPEGYRACTKPLTQMVNGEDAQDDKNDVIFFQGMHHGGRFGHPNRTAGGSDHHIRLSGGGGGGPNQTKSRGGATQEMVTF